MTTRTTSRTAARVARRLIGKISPGGLGGTRAEQVKTLKRLRKAAGEVTEDLFMALDSLDADDWDAKEISTITDPAFEHMDKADDHLRKAFRLIDKLR